MLRLCHLTLVAILVSAAFCLPSRAFGKELAPVSARGFSLCFDRTLHACLFNGDDWLLPYQNTERVSQALVSFSPTFITGAYLLSTEGPSEEVVEEWHRLRREVQEANALASFDLTVDLRRYPSASKAVEHMRAVEPILIAEAWIFTGVVEAERKAPGVLAAAVAEAHAQGRKAGVVYTQGKGFPKTDVDYVAIPYGEGGRGLQRRLTEFSGLSGGKPLQVLILSGSSLQNPGGGFAMGKTPAQRRSMVLGASKAQKKGIFYAYPVFGPRASDERSYDALRDEFMLDTIRRCIESKNPITPPVSLPGA